MKIIYQDIETGGLNPESSSLLQLSGLIEINDVIEEAFNFFISPHPHDDPLEDEALEIHGLDPKLTPEKFENYNLAFNKYISILDKYINKYDRDDKFYFIGYNSNHFDSPFIRNFFFKNGNNYYGSYFFTPTIDMFILMGYAAIGQRSLFEDFKLITVAKSLGLKIDETKLHDALYDCYVTRDLFLKFKQEYPI